MCTVETGTTTVSTSSNETTKYSCQDNAERGWIISCIYRCVCVCTYIYVHVVSEETRLHELRGRQGSKTAYIGNTIHLVFPADREGIEETRGFLKKGWIGLGDNGSVLSFDRFGNRLEDF